MTLTIGKALEELDVFSRATVVAGREGLDRDVTWAHIVDIPDITPWVHEGHLLLTTAFALKDDTDAQLKLIPNLAAKGLAGMVVAVGRYFHEIPENMVLLADELSFPIIQLPFDVPFVEVTRAIHKRILDEHYGLVQQSLDIHRVLTQLVLEGKGLDALADGLAYLVNRSITIEDENLKLLAYASVEPVDEARKLSIAQGRTPENLIQHLNEQGLFTRLRGGRRPQYVPPVPAMGLTLERIIAPIIVGEALYGYIWIIATDHPLTELDFLAIERAATVAALIISREQAIHAAEQRVKNQLIDNLINPDPHHDVRAIMEALSQLGLNQGYCALVAEADQPSPTELRQLSAFVEDALEVEGVRATAVERGRSVIVFLPISNSEAAKRTTARLVERGAQVGLTFIVGLSAPAHGAGQARTAYQEAAEALEIGKAYADQNSAVWAFDDLGFLRWLYRIPTDYLNKSRYYRLVQEMAEQDEGRGAQLLNTLEVYLDHLCNAQQAANSLFIHRNTLRQRLSKIGETWGLDLEDPHTLLNLFIAIKSQRLHRHH